MVKIEKLNKYFNKGRRNQIHIINNTTLEFESTGLVAILGSSGSGKTTLLNAIGGLDKVNKGKIYINGKKITKRTTYTKDKIRNLNIGYIFQDYKLIDNLSVYENVAISLKMIGIKDKSEIKKRVDYVLESVNMYRYRNRPAKMLSGGERQRVSIARAIVKNPNIVIADEPTGNLDSKNSLEIMNIIKAISKKKLVILVTHEVELAKFYASRIIEIQDGKITKDYENEISDSLDYKLDNKIYLKDLENIESIDKEQIKIDVYREKNEGINVKIAVKNGNIYIKSEDKKVEVVDDNSAIEFVNDNYKKIDKSIYQKYDYNIEEVISSKKKTRYSSIYGIFKSIIQGFKKIGEYSVLKKILLVGYFASAMFILYSISNIFGTLNLKDEDFITKNKNYLQVDVGKIDVDQYLEYENQEGIDYILPGNSLVTFKMKFDNYYQTSRFYLDVTGSLTSIDKISKDDIIYGRMPENQYEIVIDRMTIDRIVGINQDNGYTGNDNSIIAQVGIKTIQDVLDKKLSIDNLQDFVIVGITNKVSPSIYTFEENFINILYNFNKGTGDFKFGFITPNNEQITENILDYNLYLDDITLKKGRLPTEDYEVIVNISNKDEMKLNKTIETQVNNEKLKVVGYYESKTNRQNYFVNTNTIKYSVISSKDCFVIYPKDKQAVINSFGNLNIVDTYEKDKQNYVEKRKESVVNSLIFAGIILGISLIEIFLMMRSSFLSRIKEIGVLRAIGVKKNDIYRMFVGEILAITTVASLTGILMMTYILNTLTKISYTQNMFIMNSKVFVLGVLIVYGFNLLVGLLPLFKVLRKTPADILARHDVQ